MQNTQPSNPGRQRPERPARAGRPAPPPIPPEFQAESIMKMDSAGLVRILKDPSGTVFQKSRACQRLALVGDKDAVPALAALLPDPKLSHFARFGLAPIPDPSADDALRAALPKLKGKLLVGVINTIGQRRDAKAVPALARLLSDADVEVAQAAAASLGYISGAAAAKAIQDGLARTKGPVRVAVARAGLLCAEGLLAGGARQQAFALYDALTRAEMPKPVRLAAMHGIINAETALDRPR